MQNTLQASDMNLWHVPLLPTFARTVTRKDVRAMPLCAGPMTYSARFRHVEPKGQVLDGSFKYAVFGSLAVLSREFNFASKIRV